MGKITAPLGEIKNIKYQQNILEEDKIVRFFVFVFVVG